MDEKVTRRSFLRMAGIAGGGAAVGSVAFTRWVGTSPVPGRRRPNILFIMADDHAAHAICAYGSRVNRDAEHRPPGPRGHAVPERLRHQLDLHAEPRRDPDRPVLPPERRPGLQPLRQLAADRRRSSCRPPATTPA